MVLTPVSLEVHSLLLFLALSDSSTALLRTVVTPTAGAFVALLGYWLYTKDLKLARESTVGKVRVGIINITGYSGMELARLLYRHPEVEVASVTGRSAASQHIGEALPHLADFDMMIEPELGDVDFAFSSLPQVASAEAVIEVVKRGVKVVDISADFRLKKPDEYKEWYGATHPAPELLEESVYGLTELYRDQVKNARIIANPGCYPTSVILGLAPVLKEGLITEDIIVDSKSGVSGAGRGLGLLYHFAEANENVMAYSLNGHRHLPEMVQELKAIQPEFEPKVTFLPHLIPMTRGILSSCYVPLADNGRLPAGEAGKKALLGLYREFYKGEPFIRVVSTPPGTKQTLGNNYCIIYPTIDVRTNRLIVISCLDNLVKGAAGQAIQNMNLMLGFPETMGLEDLPVYP